MDRYRILFFISSLKTGGAEHHLLNLCRYLVREGHDPAVCTLSPVEDGLESALILDEVPLYRLPLRSLGFLATPRIDRSLRGIMKGCSADILHAHLFHAEVAAAWARRYSRAPLVVTRHSAGLEFRGWRRAIARVYGRSVSRCIAVSREAAEEAREMGCPEAKLTIIPNAVDAERFRPLDGLERERRRRVLLEGLFPGEQQHTIILIGSSGGLKPVKEYSLFMRASARLVAEGARAGAVPRFVIFGEGPERQSLAELSRRLGIERSFALPGRRDDIDEVYPLLDIFVLTSRAEGVPLALLEAMSSGAACVATDVGGIGEVLAGTGKLIPSGGEDELVAALADLIDDRALRVECGRRARVRILERYDLDIWGERILEIYRGALAPRSSR